MFLLLYGILVTVFWVGLCSFLLINRRRVGFLTDFSAEHAKEPSVVIIIAVRNEQQHLAAALQSVSKLHYGNYRILLVNDRSTDGTALIMEDFANQYPHISVLHINDLPEGWLGKNHALFQGYRHSDEEWILFTDADVLFQKKALKKAISYSLHHGLDHLTVLPFVKSRSEWLNTVLSTFVMMLEIRQQPWAVSDPKSEASLGVGAFNLLSRKAYEKAGTHQAIALRPDDDLKLGERIKQSGGKQGALYGRSEIELEWYPSIKEFISGLMKNVFSVYNYQFMKMVFAGVIPTILFFVLPLPVLLLAGGWETKIMALIIMVFQLALFADYKGGYTKKWFFLMIPFASVLMTYIMVRGSVLTLKQKGIYWRDHFYPLSELRKNV